MKEVKKHRTTVMDVLKFIFEDEELSPLEYLDKFTDDSLEEIEACTTIHVLCKDGEIWTNEEADSAYYQLDSEPGDLMRHFIYFEEAYEDYTDSDEMTGDICGY